MLFELEGNTYLKNLEVDPNTNILDEFENTSQEYHELSDDISVSADYFKDMQNNSSDDKNQEYNKFPNEAYADLIGLVTKYKLKISDIFQTFALEYEELYKTTKKTTQSTLPTSAKILSIILYSDATNCDLLGKSQLHPIYLSLGNIPTWCRNKQDAKQLLGYLPIIKSSNIGKEIKRQLFHKYLDIILEPI
ncbi:zn-finger domain-containing protein [Gigaspora margarita]|uniref:Zn-finger domain-containing protein n=1 Tax=Gigaspora margarita TaxID=4874 RepID=A0A8H3XCF2_GIGMA|nr:zn-finger domain-containing protein [Gigaspora margarita]